MTVKAQLFITGLAEQFFSPMLKDMVAVSEMMIKLSQLPGP